MNDAVDRGRVIAAARAAVTRLAPEELAVFDPVSERCARDPERGLDVGRTREDILGFGVDVAVPLLTPVAVAAAAEGLRYLVAHVGERLRGSGDARLEPAPGLTPDALGELHEIVRRKALASRLSEERATALADAVVAALAMGPG